MSAEDGRFTIGNKAAVKLKTIELKLEAYKQYCEHIAAGKSKSAWRLQHPEVSLTWRHMERYIREEPEIFDPTFKEIAECDSLNFWEQQVINAALGVNKDANVAALQMLMRNKFKWDRPDLVKDSDDSAALMAHEKLMELIRVRQSVV